MAKNSSSNKDGSKNSSISQTKTKTKGNGSTSKNSGSGVVREICEKSSRSGGPKTK